MDDVMILILLFGGISLILFFIAALIARPIVIHRMEKLSKENKCMYIISIAFMIIAVIIFLLSSLTIEDLTATIMEL